MTFVMESWMKISFLMCVKQRPWQCAVCMCYHTHNLSLFRIAFFKRTGFRFLSWFIVIKEPANFCVIFLTYINFSDCQMSHVIIHCIQIFNYLKLTSFKLRISTKNLCSYQGCWKILFENVKFLSSVINVFKLTQLFDFVR